MIEYSSQHTAKPLCAVICCTLNVYNNQLTLITYAPIAHRSFGTHLSNYIDDDGFCGRVYLRVCYGSFKYIDGVYIQLRACSPIRKRVIRDDRGFSRRTRRYYKYMCRLGCGSE